MVAPLAIAGIASLAGSAISALGNQISSDNSIAQARQNNAMQLAWEREKFNKEIELANTAHQREMEDYKAAGINPLLALGGKGSPVPTANAIQPQMGDYSGYGRMGDAFAAGIQNAIQNSMQIEKQDAEINLINAQKNKTIAEEEAIRKDYEPGGIKEIEKETKTEERNKLKNEALRIAAQTAYQEIENAIKNKDLKWYEADKIINYVLKVLPIAGLSGLINSLGKKAVKAAVKEETKNAIKNKNFYKNDYGGKRYELRNDGIVDMETGEFHEWGGFH